MTTILFFGVAIVIAFVSGVLVGLKLERRKADRMLGLMGDAAVSLFRGFARGEVEIVHSKKD